MYMYMYDIVFLLLRGGGVGRVDFSSNPLTDISSSAQSSCLTHLSLASHKWDLCKQCRPRSDAAERGV